MATVTLNRNAQVLRIDLTTQEFAAIDAILTASGTAPIEQILAYLIQQQQQEKVERLKGKLKDYIERAQDAKRAQLESIMNADNAV